METMYDRLGDLLNETLENGAVKFVRIVRPDGEPDGKAEPLRQTIYSAESLAEQELRRQKKAAGRPAGSADTESGQVKKKASSRHASPQGAAGQRQRACRVKRLFPSAAGQADSLRTLSPEEERARRLLGVSAASSAADIRKAYKEKLKYYHPDRYAGNPVLSKIATDKTREIVAAYTLLSTLAETGGKKS
ncbi:MAG TPA: hypothetical protein DDW78_08150 [Treponema sp.]|nr:hypothetical protein [Treponema sp.]